jgi:hypothetical protein
MLQLAEENIPSLKNRHKVDVYYPPHPILLLQMYLKMHNVLGRSDIIAVCDRELLNTTITCSTCDIIIDHSFYGDVIASDSEVLAALSSSTNANLIGKRVCNLAIAAGLIDKKSCIMIGDVPHAQIYGF